MPIFWTNFAVFGQLCAIISRRIYNTGKFCFFFRKPYTWSTKTSYKLFLTYFDFWKIAKKIFKNAKIAQTIVLLPGHDLAVTRLCNILFESTDSVVFKAVIAFVPGPFISWKTARRFFKKSSSVLH
jgi:hypothetical protein